MRISVVNEASHALAPGLTRAVLDRICDAVMRQTIEHYAPFWEATGCEVSVADSLAHVPAGDAVVAILDSADQAGVLGYHATTPNGRPYAKVFLGPIVVNGGSIMTSANSLSVTLSHEILELLGDPYATWWGDGPDGTEHALELCDAVEGDAYGIEGVMVSNFVGPRWFSDGPGPYDWMRKLKAPFSMTEGGYQITRTAGKDVSQTFAFGFPGWKLAGKAFPAARTSRRRAS